MWVWKEVRKGKSKEYTFMPLRERGGRRYVVDFAVVWWVGDVIDALQYVYFFEKKKNWLYCCDVEFTYIWYIILVIMKSPQTGP